MRNAWCVLAWQRADTRPSESRTLAFTQCPQAIWVCSVKRISHTPCLVNCGRCPSHPMVHQTVPHSRSDVTVFGMLSCAYLAANVAHFVRGDASRCGPSQPRPRLPWRADPQTKLSFVKSPRHLSREPSRNHAGHNQDQQHDHQQTQATSRVIPPLATVWPSGKDPDKQKYQHDKENQSHEKSF